MRAPGRSRHRLNLLLAVLTLLQLVAAAKIPGVTRKQFPNPLSEVQYFDDSDVVLVTDEVLEKDSKVWRSKDAGATWDPVEELGEGRVGAILMNPHDNKVAIALSAGVENKHWITKDRGDEWKSFELPEEAIPSFRSAQLVSFHADDSDKIIVNTRTAKKAQAVYTTDGFKTITTLREDSLRCLWAKEQPQFNAEVDKDRMLCVVGGRYSPTTDAQRLLISDSFFKDEYEPELEDGRPVQGIVSVVAARGFVLAARSTSGTSEMALYVSTDTKKWHRANFGEHQLKDRGYTIMDSTNYSLQVDVRTGSDDLPPMGALFTSNSLGFNFVMNEDATNRNHLGFVDFEKVTNIQGIVLVNIVDNVDAVKRDGATKRLRSQISFDDGRSFHDIKTGEERLHLHSVTDASNVGAVFSSPAPGMLMGIGNTGPSLKLYDQGDLYVSDNAGRTWRRALGGPHKYEFGDQGSLLVAVYDGSVIDKISYSTNHGKDFTAVPMKDTELEQHEFRVRSLTTHPDSTSLKFIMRAHVGGGSDQKNYLYSIDFNKLDRRECKDDDFERWQAVVDSDGKPECIMGHKQSFRRRKADADCFIGVKFKDPMPEYDSDGCTCTIKDFECDAGFRRTEDRKECKLEAGGSFKPPSDKCQGDEKTFMGTNGFRKIPGNQCKDDKENPIAKMVEYPCEGKATKPNDGEIRTELTQFDAGSFREYYYLERAGSSSDELFGFPDETIVAGTEDPKQVWMTHDHGKKWQRILEDEQIYAIYPHRYFNDKVYFIGPTKKVYYSPSRGKSIEHFDAPAPPNTRRLQILRFHPDKEDWLIWTSCTDTRECVPEAHVSTKGGDNWTLMLKGVGDCEFVWREGRKTDQKMVYCAQHVNHDLDARIQLLSSEDWFDNKKTHFDDVINFATMSEYIVVAAKDKKDSQFLTIDASVDGINFADARFPTNLKNSTSTAYTVLDSSTHSIFLHVTVNAVHDQEYGTIIKSNSNGTSYTLSLRDVNRNEAGYVDFEKITNMEGVAIANVVANVEAVNGGASKNLQSKITHNDGADWDFISSPLKDAEGKDYECKHGDSSKTCALHLHGYTERVDPRDTFGSASAVGFMLGVGNVGEYLGPKREANTFMSTDGGFTWLTAKNGQYMWEFGDQGGIVVIVAEGTPTNVVYYSRDEGKTWTEHKFNDKEIPITDITTVPSDTSMNFLLWGIGRERQAVTINIDFSGLVNRQCKLGEPGTKDSDYTIFEPKHPYQDNNCLFGHIWQYYRRKPEVTDCYNGPRLKEDGFIKEAKKCQCTLADFECDYNYERTKDGCKLVPGHTPLSKTDWCAAHPDADTWYKPSGFRRIPLTTCDGGKQLDINGEPEPCPGKEEEFKKKHKGLSGVGLFFVILLSIAAAGGIGYWVYKNYENAFGMGRIRLGDSGSGSGGISLRSGGGDWTKYPVMVISGAAAVVMVVPMLMGSVWRRVKEWTPWRSRGYASYRPYTSRSSFARGRRDYVSVGGQDESDLLGEDSDDDV